MQFQRSQRADERSSKATTEPNGRLDDVPITKSRSDASATNGADDNDVVVTFGIKSIVKCSCR